MRLFWSLLCGLMLLFAACVPFPVMSTPLPAGTVADVLPQDQPWIWASSTHCNIQGGLLLAVDPAGAVTQLNTGVLTTIARPGTLPLLIACSDPGRFTVIDPVSGVRTLLDAEAGPNPYGFVLSPDGTKIAFTVLRRSPFVSAAGAETQAEFVQVADLTTGAVEHIIDVPEIRHAHPYHVQLAGWGRQGLYLHTSGLESVLWRIDVAASPVTFERVAELAYDTWQFNAAAELLARVEFPNGQFTLHNLRSDETWVVEEQMAGFHRPHNHSQFRPLAPDGTMLAYLRQIDNQQDELSGGEPQWELIALDVPTGRSSMLADQFYGWQGLVWSEPGKHILLQAQPYIVDAEGEVRGIEDNHVFVFARDGSRVGYAHILGSVVDAQVTADDELLYTTRLYNSTSNGQLRLHLHPLQVGEVRSWDIEIVPRGIAMVVYAP